MNKNKKESAVGQTLIRLSATNIFISAKTILVQGSDFRQILGEKPN